MADVSPPRHYDEYPFRRIVITLDVGVGSPPEETGATLLRNVVEELSSMGQDVRKVAVKVSDILMASTRGF